MDWTFSRKKVRLIIEKKVRDNFEKAFEQSLGEESVSEEEENDVEEE